MVRFHGDREKLNSAIYKGDRLSLQESASSSFLKPAHRDNLSVMPLCMALIAL